FQFVPQNSMADFKEKQAYLLGCIGKNKKIRVSYSDTNVSFLEAVFARGDRRLSKVIVDAYLGGCIFDGWTEAFKYNLWQQAFENNGIDMSFYANRARNFDEINPWDHINYGVTKSFLIEEYNRSLEAMVSKPCNRQCNNCGANKLLGRACFEYCEN
ncbi:MAG: B12-binding domain-containing radical SAM protein, partial [Oscillospiraceae bacterium]